MIPMGLGSYRSDIGHVLRLRIIRRLKNGAQEETRTPMLLRALAPEASASTNSATWAQVRRENRVIKEARELV
jgi:hypothetical protein